MKEIFKNIFGEGCYSFTHDSYLSEMIIDDELKTSVKNLPKSIEENLFVYYDKPIKSKGYLCPQLLSFVKTCKGIRLDFVPYESKQSILKSMKSVKICVKI